MATQAAQQQPRKYFDGQQHAPNFTSTGNLKLQRQCGKRHPRIPAGKRRVCRDRQYLAQSSALGTSVVRIWLRHIFFFFRLCASVCVWSPHHKSTVLSMRLRTLNNSDGPQQYWNDLRDRRYARDFSRKAVGSGCQFVPFWLFHRIFFYTTCLPISR